MKTCHHGLFGSSLVDWRAGAKVTWVQVWPRVWFAGFVIVSFLLALLMSMFNLFEMPDEDEAERLERKSNIEAIGTID